MSEPLVRRTDRDGVTTIELNRPERKNAIMGPQATGLSDDDIADLAAYYSQLPGLKTPKR